MSLQHMLDATYGLQRDIANIVCAYTHQHTAQRDVDRVPHSIYEYECNYVPIFIPFMSRVDDERHGIAYQIGNMRHVRVPFIRGRPCGMCANAPSRPRFGGVKTCRMRRGQGHGRKIEIRGAAYSNAYDKLHGFSVRGMTYTRVLFWRYDFVATV